MIERLIHLAQRKNDLNRRRHRFYYYWTQASPRMGAYRKCKTPGHIGEAEAIAGYRKAQADMKAMTPTMRELRTEIGAKFEWDDRGAIFAVIYQDVRIKEKDFKAISNLYLAERYILGAE